MNLHHSHLCYIVWWFSHYRTPWFWSGYSDFHIRFSVRIPVTSDLIRSKDMIVNVSKKYDQRSTVYTDFYLSFCHLPFSYESSTGPPIAWIRPRVEADLSDEYKHEKGLTGKNVSAYLFCSTLHVTPRRCYQGVYKALTVLKNPRVVILWHPPPRAFSSSR